MNQFLSCHPCETRFFLGSIETEQDCTNYVIKRSQICAVAFLPFPNVFNLNDWTSAAIWQTILDNTNASADKGKYLVGEGAIGQPDKVIRILPKGRRKVARRVYSLQFRVKNLSDTQYDFLLKFQCDFKAWRFWYEGDGELFGGISGITPLYVDVDLPHELNRTSRNYADLIIRWDADGDAPRALFTGDLYPDSDNLQLPTALEDDEGNVLMDDEGNILVFP